MPVRHFTLGSAKHFKTKGHFTNLPLADLFHCVFSVKDNTLKVSAFLFSIPARHKLIVSSKQAQSKRSIGASAIAQSFFIKCRVGRVEWVGEATGNFTSRDAN